MLMKLVVRWIFLVSNSAFWALSLILTSFLIWIGVTDHDVLLYTDTGMALVYVLALSVISTFVLGFIGCCIGINLNSKLIKTYLVLIIIFLLYELAVLITLAVLSTRSTTMAFDDWKEADPDFRDEIQRENNCCGYYGFPDHVEIEERTRPSCYNITQDGNTTIYKSHKDPCSIYLEGVVSEYLIIPLVIVVLIFCFQIVGLGTGADLLRRVRKVVVVAGGDKPKKRHKYRFITSPFTMALEKHRRLEQEEEEDEEEVGHSNDAAVA